jgi:hypothetical protein
VCAPVADGNAVLGDSEGGNEPCGYEEGKSESVHSDEFGGKNTNLWDDNADLCVLLHQNEIKRNSKQLKTNCLLSEIL